MNNNNIKEKEINLSTIYDTSVAIVGIGFRIPSGNDKVNNSPSILWDNLMNGFNGVVKTTERFSDNYFKNDEISNNYSGLLPFDEIKSFDPLFFGINPNESKTIDPVQRLLLKCTWEALEDALIDPISIKGTDTSVFIGCTGKDYHNLNMNQIKNNFIGSASYSISNRISYCFGINGCSLTIDTACSSSSNAVLLGYDSIKNKKSKLSLVGGVNLILDPSYSQCYSAMNFLSKSKGNCNSFDESADGFTRSECIGIVVLKNLKDAIADGNNIYCTIDGASSNVDNIENKDKLNLCSPSAISQYENMKQALLSTNGKVSSVDIDYVEAHGTGTPTGDPIETKSISMIIENNKYHSKDNPLLIGSIKSNIGHPEAASGIASLIKCCLMFKNKFYVPNINFNKPNPNIKFDEWNLKVLTQPIPFKTNKSTTSIIVNNFGVTGSNCCLILSQFNKINQSETTTSLLNKPLLIPFSANSIESLKKYQSLAIGNNNTFEFIEFAMNQIYKKPISLYQRSVKIAKDWDQLNNKQQSYQTIDNVSSNMTIKKLNPLTIFVFNGQGSQYKSMASELYNNEPHFKKTMDFIDEKLSKYYGYSVLKKLRSINENDINSLHDPKIAQSSNIMIQISLFELYKYWGVNPSFIIGHSLGEITSAYCSGMIDIDQLCYLVYHRSIVQSLSYGGRMLSINISSEEYNSKYSSNYPSVEISCYNSPNSIVIGGTEEMLKQISKELTEKGIFCAMLANLASFHTSSQNIIKDHILNIEIGKTYPPKIPTFSTVTSHLFDFISPTFSSQYVFDNLINPVLFTQTISNIYKHIQDNQLGTNIVFIEIGSHPTLQYYLNQMVPTDSNYFSNKSISIYSPLHKKKNDVEEFNKTISQLYCQNGYNINFKCQFSGNGNIDHFNNSKIELPLYQWDDQIYWLDNSINHKQIKIGPPISILGNSMVNYSPNSKSYQTIINIKNEPFQYLKGYNVSGNVVYFPNTGYIDNILKLYPKQNLTISSIEFKSPLILIQGEDQYLQTNVHQIGKYEYKAEFHYKDEKTDTWIKSASAIFQLFNHNNNCDGSKYYKLNIDEIMENKCNLTNIEWDEIYPHIKIQTGLNYQGIFQNITDCYLGDSCSLIEVSLELPKNFHDKESFFNASILDVCTHGTLVYIKEQCKLVVDKIEGIKYYSSNIPNDRSKENSIFAYSQLKSRIGSSYCSSIVIMLSDGTVLIEIDNIVFTSLVKIIDPLKIETPFNSIYTPYLQSKNSLIKSTSEFKSIYQSSGYTITTNGEIVKQIIKPLLNEKIEFRILLIGDKITSTILNIIDSLLNENIGYEIDIEITLDKSIETSIMNFKNISLIYKSFDIIQESLDKLNPSYYDIIIISFENNDKSINKAGCLNSIYNILTPNGHLLLNEISLNEKSLSNELINCGFNMADILISGQIIQAQKTSFQNQQHQNCKFDKIIVFCNEEQTIEMFLNEKEQQIDNIIKISTIDQFNQLSSSITNFSIIYFIKTMNQLNLDNFKSVTYEYIQINQKLYELKCSCKHVLVTVDSQSTNYLAASVLGCARYFDELPQLQLYILDIDGYSCVNKILVTSTVQLLINPKRNIHNELFIKNGFVYFERYKKESRNLKRSLKSNSYHNISNERDSLISKLDSNLEYTLCSKQTTLKPNEIEVEIKATGINYKDVLKTSGDSFEIGNDFSGIVTRVGSKSENEFKIGDSVYGIGLKTTSSHIITDSMIAFKKPENLNHTQAASIPTIYSTSLHALYNIVNLQSDETVLVHLSQDIGLAVLEILKWKSHSFPIFVTIDNDDKKQYLIDHYGDLISGIYSSRNKNYENQIKEKLIELGYQDNESIGIDVVLYSSSRNFIDLNLNCLNIGCRIIDLNTNKNIGCFAEFKFNYSYHSIELLQIKKQTFKKLLKSISTAIETNQLNGLIPITEYSISNIKQAIEYIDQNKHIGKIVVNHDIDILGKLINNSQNDSYQKILKSNYQINNLGKTVLVTGQSGLVLDILKWMVKYSKSITHIIIFSQSSLKWGLEYLINNKINKHIKFIFKSIDVSNNLLIDKTIDSILLNNPTITNIDSIFHFACCTAPKKVQAINIENVNVSHGAKTLGAINLHNQSIKRFWKLLNFILPSSVSTITGSNGLCSYISANCVLESLTKYRRSIGLPSICINIGGISNSGYLTRNELSTTITSSQGLGLININELLGTIDLEIQKTNNQHSNLLLTNFDLPLFKSFKQKIHQKFDFILNPINNIVIDHGNCTDYNNNHISEKLLNKISQLLSIEPSKINKNIKLMNYGADSLLTVHFKSFTDQEWVPNLITINEIQSNTISDIFKIIISSLEKMKNEKK